MRNLSGRTLFVLFTTAGSACDGIPPLPDGGTADGGTADGGPLDEGPVETRPPNGVGQKPAFPGQTRAPRRTANVAFEVRTVARGIFHPWAIEVLADGRMLVTEREGRLRIITPGGQISAPVAGLPAVDTRGQGGLHDLTVDPAFATNRILYWSYAEPRTGGNGTTLASGRLVTSSSPARVEGVKVLFRQLPTFDSELHFGSRIVFAPDGTLFLTLGERFVPAARVQAQDLNSHFGKVIRIKTDGTVPPDNPFVRAKNARPEIWSYGHRNIQAGAINPMTGKLWTVEHGPRGGDEVNAPEAGKNYGWPIITYGIDYDGSPIGEGITAKEGMEQPLYYWDPVIAPSGMLFYTGSLFPAWRGSLFIGGLAGKHLVRLTLDGQRVIGEERLLASLGQRIRDVAQGPEGAIYVITDEVDARVYKLVPRS